MPYAGLRIPWAHHPLTMPLLGSRGFSVIDDGGEYARSDKIAVISEWPEAMRHLRVCFGGDIPGKHENCCCCEKCTRTILAFRIAGQSLPAAFKSDVTNEQIRSMRLKSDENYERWKELDICAREAGLGDTDWAKAIRSALRLYKWRSARKVLLHPFVPIRNAIRQWTRGSTLSRSKLAAMKDRSNHTSPSNRS